MDTKAFDTYVYVEGKLVLQQKQCLPVQVGETIYLSDNTPLLVELVEMFGEVQEVHAFPFSDK